jgi:hypothetical protein
MVALLGRKDLLWRPPYEYKFHFSILRTEYGVIYQLEGDGDWGFKASCEGSSRRGKYWIRRQFLPLSR